MNTTSLAEEYAREQARCRELLVAYERIPEGAFGAMMLRQILEMADAAAKSGNEAAMLRSYKKMRGCK